jgi:hypothetical protein
VSAPRGPGIITGLARRALAVLCYCTCLLHLLTAPAYCTCLLHLAHCTTDQIKVALPETPSVSVAVTVTV